MNKVYFAISNEDIGGTYVAAPNIKIAKSIARRCSIIKDYMDSFFDLKIHLMRKDGKPVETKASGEMSTQEIVDAGLAWWDCSECDGNNFKIDEMEERYTCLNCNCQGNIPYVGVEHDAGDTVAIPQQAFLYRVGTLDNEVSAEITTQEVLGMPKKAKSLEETSQEYKESYCEECNRDEIIQDREAILRELEKKEEALQEEISRRYQAECNYVGTMEHRDTLVRELQDAHEKIKVLQEIQKKYYKIVNQEEQHCEECNRDEIIQDREAILRELEAANDARAQMDIDLTRAREEIRELRETKRWRSVSKELPDNDTPVLILSRHKHSGERQINISAYTYAPYLRGKTWLQPYEYFNHSDIVTHWVPIPELLLEVQKVNESTRLTKQWGKNNLAPTKLDLGECADLDETQWQHLMDIIKRLADYEDICYKPDGTERITLDELRDLIRKEE